MQGLQPQGDHRDRRSMCVETWQYGNRYAVCRQIGALCLPVRTVPSYSNQS